MLLQQAEVLRATGDTFRAAGDVSRALLFYDAAIDLYLRSNQPVSASVVCEQVVLLAPNGVRARCTLAWIAVLLARQEIVLRRIAEYAETAEIAGQGDRACRQLRCMAEESDEPAVLEVIADALLHLGDEPSSNRVYARIYDRQRPARVYDTTADHARVVAARLTMAIST
ncbi:MAG: hypothetical protein ABIV28_05940 [Longimicrobiales bacterium]